MKTLKTIVICMLGFVCSATFAQQSDIEFHLDVKKKGAVIQPTMYGLFFEDINFAADGGLYAELVKNRSFDFPQALMGWKTFGKVTLSKENSPFERNPNYVILTDAGHQHKHTGIENEGFRGMGFKKNEKYCFSVWAKLMKTTNEQKLRVELIDSKNNILDAKEVIVNSGAWKKYQVELTPKETEAKSSLRIFLTTRNGGSVALEHISLFPADTYMGRENGLRKDLAQALADIKPGVFRFPGGCIVEGTDLETRYDWKKSIGIVENRPVNENRWHYTFPRKFFPDYYQSYGLGFYEYFLLSEDIGAEPLPVINVGLACQYQNKTMDCHVAVEDLDSYVQDALDLIEFANGDVTTTWGKVRAEMGHPESFNLKFIGVGNEQWGEEYVERLAVFTKAIRTQCPDIKIIGSSGPSADGKHFEYLWPEMKRLKVDLVDEHYYQTPEWFLKNADRYDNYDRKGPAVFAGEYACHDRESNKDNNFLSALYEAAFMTGLERNADIVHMCTYAPLLAHVDAWQWNPDMIWFDNLSLLKTPNYYIQQLYGQNAGTNVAQLTWDNKPITGQNGLYASAVFDKYSNSYIIKVVNTEKEKREIKINLKGVKENKNFSIGDCVMLQHNNLKDINTFDSPNKIVPQKVITSIERQVLFLTAESTSFSVHKVIQE